MSFISNLILVEKQKLKAKIRVLREEVKQFKKAYEEDKKEKKDKKEKALFEGATRQELYEKENSTSQQKNKKGKLNLGREYRSRQLKLTTYRARLHTLSIIEYAIRLVSLFIQAMIYIFGPVLAIVIIVAAILIIVMMTLLNNGNLDLESKPDDMTQVEQGVGGTGCGAAWTEEELATRGALLTDEEKNLYRLVMLSRQFVEGELTGHILYEGEALIAQIYSVGISSTETSMRFFENRDNHANILKVPSDKGVNSSQYGMFGLNKSDQLSTYLDATQEAKIKSMYIPESTPKYTINYAPYGVTMQMHHFKQKLNTARTNKTAEKAREIGAKFGISATMDSFVEFCELSMAQAGYHGINYGEEQEGYITFWAALWAASNDDDSKRGIVENVEYVNAGYDESNVRHTYIGQKNGSVRTVGHVASPRDLKLNSRYTSRMKINGEVLDETLWAYLDIKYRGVVPQWNKAWEVQQYNSNNYTGGAADRSLNFTYGINSFIQGATIMRDIQAKLTGDICGEGGYSGVVGDIRSSGEGEIQGNWAPWVKEKLGQSKYKYMFGTVHAIKNPDSTMSGTDMTYDEWRNSNKWGLPYYHQGADYREGGNKIIYINGMNMPSQGCHTLMMAAMASSITGDLIAPVEMGEAMRITGGITSGGLFNNGDPALNSIPDALGLHIARIGPSGTYTVDKGGYFKSKTGDEGSTASKKAQQKVDKVLEMGGIAGTTMGLHYMEGYTFTTGRNHYIVIMDKIGDKYQVASYASSPVRDTVLYTWQDIFTAAGKSSMSGKVQIYVMMK